MVKPMRTKIEDWLRRFYLKNIKDARFTQLSRIENKLERLEYYSHGARATFVGNNRVLVKVVVGGHNIAYYVEADDKLISPWFIITGTYEIPLTDFFLREVGSDSHCIDVGANFGFFTCLMARLCPRGKVLSVEADEHVFELCRDNLAINGLDRIGTALHAAVNDSGEAITLHRRNGRSGNTSIIAVNKDFTDRMGEAPSEPFTVEGLRLDDLLPRLDGRVDFMKIDVEGCEPLAFRGARGMIASNPQLKIVMEWSPGQIRSAGFDVPDFLDELTDQGLKIFKIGASSIEKISKDALLNIDYLAGVVLKR
jgi:FkbM family methyltransferase